MAYELIDYPGHLEKCPWCGERPLVEKMFDDTEFADPIFEPLYAVGCGNTDCPVGPWTGYGTLADAVFDWNGCM